MKDLKFKSTSRVPDCLFSNLYGDVELEYMSRKFQNPKVKAVIKSWRRITDLHELNNIRYQLERCRVDGDGRIVPKGGKSGMPYTTKQTTTYCCEFRGKTYLAIVRRVKATVDQPPTTLTMDEIDDQFRGVHREEIWNMRCDRYCKRTKDPTSRSDYFLHVASIVSEYWLPLKRLR